TYSTDGDVVGAAAVAGSGTWTESDVAIDEVSGFTPGPLEHPAKATATNVAGRRCRAVANIPTERSKVPHLR
ncbi:MAG: hypothetical protein JWM61_465, partial [Micrococcaceae bacterium]|nr:hypothetical protein [Micrococcaceae bacterium]